MARDPDAQPLPRTMATPAAPRIIRLPTGYDPLVEPAPEPGPDGFYRDTVYEKPSLDPLGRRQFVAVDGNAQDLLTLVAESPENIERVRTKLWSAVFAWRDRNKPVLLK